jgi:hypothetical protein
MTGEEAMTLTVRVAGALHFTQLPAMMAAGRMLNWREQLSALTPLNRRIVQVIGLAIVLVMCGLGAVLVVAADELVRGGRLATGVSAFVAVFLGYRAWVQWVVYAPIWPRHLPGRLCHWALALMFSAQATVYAAACGYGLLLGSRP